MKTAILAGVAALAIAGSTAVYAQHRPWLHHERLTAQDRIAFADARIAAVHAGLQLSPDQEKMWPAVESAVRDFAKLRIDRAAARMQERQNRDEMRDRPQQPDDPIARLQRRADAMSSTGAVLKRIADAADPLYKSLDEGQKRRLAMLTHGRFGGGEGWRHRRGVEHDRFGNDSERRGDRSFERGDRDRGMDRDREFQRGDRDQGLNGDRRGEREFDRGDKDQDRNQSLDRDHDQGQDQDSDRDGNRDHDGDRDRGPGGDLGPRRERL